METQTRPSEFTRKQCLSPVLEKTGKSKTIVVKTTQVESTTIDFTRFNIFLPCKMGVFNVRRCNNGVEMNEQSVDGSNINGLMKV